MLCVNTLMTWSEYPLSLLLLGIGSIQQTLGHWHPEVPGLKPHQETEASVLSVSVPLIFQ